MLIFRVEANRFLRGMVRSIVGTLVEVGRGRLDPAGIAAVLEARDRARAGPTAPPHGLYLVEVTYG
jgi:tRNA pseudouridine38-40 synthase